MGENHIADHNLERTLSSCQILNSNTVGCFVGKTNYPFPTSTNKTMRNIIFIDFKENPELVPVEERYSSRRNKGGSFVSASANNDFFVSDGVNNMSKGGAVTSAAGVNKMTECSEVDGSTVLGE